MQFMRQKMESISRKDRLWIASMKICGKLSGCHQMPERSFFVGSRQFPLCARCTGIAAGHVLGAVVSFFRPVSFGFLLGTLPLMIDGITQQITSYESTNRRRLWTGLLYGFGMMSAFIRGLGKIAEVLGLTGKSGREKGF